MSRFTTSTRKLVAAAGSSVDHQQQSVTLVLEQDDGKTLDVVLDAAVIPMVLGLLQARWAEMSDHLPEEKRPLVQTFEAMKIRALAAEAGTVGLVVSLQGGGDLPILLQPHMAENLISECNDALSEARRQEN